MAGCKHLPRVLSLSIMLAAAYCVCLQCGPRRVRTARATRANATRHETLISVLELLPSAFWIIHSWFRHVTLHVVSTSICLHEINNVKLVQPILYNFSSISFKVLSLLTFINAKRNILYPFTIHYKVAVLI